MLDFEARKAAAVAEMKAYRADLLKEVAAVDAALAAWTGIPTEEPGLSPAVKASLEGDLVRLEEVRAASDATEPAP